MMNPGRRGSAKKLDHARMVPRSMNLGWAESRGKSSDWNDEKDNHHAEQPQEVHRETVLLIEFVHLLLDYLPETPWLVPLRRWL
mmetsp:Transcript_92033/g.168822  ORF Transcript_92033/g.168822 Transcript_92033/m.168822 type:complete len:84 (+) Transcript_92033:3-254(+)